MRPKILLVTTRRWPAAALLGMAFSQIGCRVELIGPRGHPAESTLAFLRVHRFRAAAPISSLRKAIETSQPNHIIPCDDQAAFYLHCFYISPKREETFTPSIQAMLERSLGAPENYTLLAARSSLISIAQSLDVLIAKTGIVRDNDDLRAWLSSVGYPAVLKLDGTSGGEGVRMVSNIKEAETSFKELKKLPPAYHADTQACSKQDAVVLSNGLQALPRDINGQAYIAGRDATCSVACWEGRVAALTSFEILKTTYASGPASVLRLIEHTDITNAAQRLVGHLKLSGIYGFDFRLEATSGRARLIEVNARATQTSHLALGTGRDIPAALYAMIRGTAIPETKCVTQKDVVALFPQEWNRDPASQYLQSAFHDVPWPEPALVKKCIQLFLTNTPNRARAQSRQLLMMLHEKLHARCN